MITIVNYGMGNLGSVQNMFKRIGAQCEITSDIDRIDKASKLLLPGVGAFDAAMQKIAESNLTEILNKKALVDKVPVLGVCLGMQLLTNGSEEGSLKGLGWIDADTIKFRFKNPQAFKVPHMGWNEIHIANDSPLLTGLNNESRFYFVHSYYVRVNKIRDLLTTTSYDTDFHSIVQHDNIFGAQFHPEKSHRFGMQLLKNFATI